jgi:hypothetical protein
MYAYVSQAIYLIQVFHAFPIYPNVLYAPPILSSLNSS